MDIVLREVLDIWAGLSRCERREVLTKINREIAPRTPLESQERPASPGHYTNPTETVIPESPDRQS